jgi:hypothetical protein
MGSHIEFGLAAMWALFLGTPSAGMVQQRRKIEMIRFTLGIRTRARLFSCSPSDAGMAALALISAPNGKIVWELAYKQTERC